MFILKDEKKQTAIFPLPKSVGKRPWKSPKFDSKKYL